MVLEFLRVVAYGTQKARTGLSGKWHEGNIWGDGTVFYFAESIGTFLSKLKSYTKTCAFQSGLKTQKYFKNTIITSYKKILFPGSCTKESHQTFRKYIIPIQADVGGVIEKMGLLIDPTTWVSATRGFLLLLCPWSLCSVH